MKRVLVIATVVQKHIKVFHLPILKMFQEKGYRTYVAAANDTEQEYVEIPYCDEYVEIGFERNPMSLKNIKAYLELKKLIDSTEFDIVHCHTPVGGILGRLAARKARKHGTKVLYTAHGFHFYKGAPLLNWLLYYPIEKICSRLTDVLITINHEDYDLAKYKMKAKKVEYVPGVGIDLKKFENIQIDREKKRREISVPEDAILLTSVGEISVRKNHKVILEALTKIENEKIHYAIVGNGELFSELKSFVIEHGIAHRVHFLGYRKDVVEIYKVSDICCLPSIHEGLPVALMEGMASGLPCIASRIRGNVDLLEESELLFDITDVDGIVKVLLSLISNAEWRLKIGNENKECVRKYSIDIITKEMESIYES